MRIPLALTLVLCLVPSLITHAQEHDRYLLLATQRTGTMQDEVNEAAARGYRVVAASRTEGTEVVVVLEQAIGEYRYKLLATTRTGTLQRELNEAAEQGYRVLPRGVTTKRTQNRSLAAALGNSNPGEGELLILMEKGPGGNNGALYQVLATTKTGTLHKELGQAADKGFKLLSLVSRGEHLAILERTSDR